MKRRSKLRGGTHKMPGLAWVNLSDKALSDSPWYCGRKQKLSGRTEMLCIANVGSCMLVAKFNWWASFQLPYRCAQLMASAEVNLARKWPSLCAWVILESRGQRGLCSCRNSTSPSSCTRAFDSPASPLEATRDIQVWLLKFCFLLHGSCALYNSDRRSNSRLAVPCRAKSPLQFLFSLAGCQGWNCGFAMQLIKDWQTFDGLMRHSRPKPSWCSWEELGIGGHHSKVSIG